MNNLNLQLKSRTPAWVHSLPKKEEEEEILTIQFWAEWICFWAEAHLLLLHPNEVVLEQYWRFSILILPRSPAVAVSSLSSYGLNQSKPPFPALSLSTNFHCLFYLFSFRSSAPRGRDFPKCP